jgi:flavin reductase (DIM6/NTAB) family NADH-FMN oxidoreductase RutF
LSPAAPHDYASLDAEGMDTATAYRLLCGVVAPRPVAWITTVDDHGLVNAAPFSSYNYVAHSPPMVAVNIGRRGPGLKDTARNIERSGEFVVNVATLDTLEPMHQSSAEYPPERSETEALSLALLPGRWVGVPRIAITPVQMECRLHAQLSLGPLNTLYIGRVLGFHLGRSVYDGRNVDTVKLQPVARLGGPYYAALGQIFERPVLQAPPGGLAPAAAAGPGPARADARREDPPR